MKNLNNDAHFYLVILFCKGLTINTKLVFFNTYGYYLMQIL